MNLRLIALLVAVSSLSACGSVKYRCSLDSRKQPDSPTACVTMQEALEGAEQGRGGRVSAVMADDGRWDSPKRDAKGGYLPANLPVPVSMPGTTQGVSQAGPYVAPSGRPGYTPPQVYQTWSKAYVDADGHLHDGHTAWFTTPGAWDYGSLNRPGATPATSRHVMSPAKPLDIAPTTRVVPTAALPASVRSAKELTVDSARSATNNSSNDALKSLGAQVSSMAPANGQVQPAAQVGNKGAPTAIDGAANSNAAPANGITRPATQLQ